MIQWQNEVVDPGLRAAGQTAETLKGIQPKVNDLINWQAAAQRGIEAVTQTAFDKWLAEKYEPTKTVAKAASPQSTFDEYVWEMEALENRRGRDPQIRSSQLEGDSAMARGGNSGKHTALDTVENSQIEDGPAATVKRRHASKESTPTPQLVQHSESSPCHPDAQEFNVVLVAWW